MWIHTPSSLKESVGWECSSVVEHLPRDRAQVPFPGTGQMDGMVDG